MISRMKNLSSHFKISVALLALTSLSLSGVFVVLERERLKREDLAKLAKSRAYSPEYRIDVQRPLQMDPEVIERKSTVLVAEVR
jgi:hypothetical protein